MKSTEPFTEGRILSSLLRFAVPVLFSLFLQALYGGVDLLVVGQFASTSDVSGVATGSMLLQTVTMIITGLSMGITILVGEKTGMKKLQEAGQAVGTGICLFAVFALVLTAVMTGAAGLLARLMHAPQEAYSHTLSYIRICGAGSVFIVSYNVLGAVFRGIGDSKTPLMTVAIACVINIAGDLLLVAVFHMGAAGAALATVAAQAASVVISLFVIRKKGLPFPFSRSFIRFRKHLILKELKLGTPVALQELLVGFSFLVIQTVVNSFGVTDSAAIGVGEKVCVFIMLVPSACMQSMSAFTAQNMGAGKPERAKRALGCGISVSFAAGLIMAYAIDCMLTPFLFCFTGYYNGCERTLFVMIQGLIGAFLVRIPLVLLTSRTAGVTLFQIGLATPASTVVQICLCLAMFLWLNRQGKGRPALHTDV